MQRLSGLYTALVTPFDAEGNIDEEGFRRNIQYQLKNLVDGLVVLGTTGEAPTLTEREKCGLIKIAREETAGRVPLIVGTGSYATQQTIENTIQAEELGADAALVITPYYNKPTQEGLYQHFKKIAQSVSLPIIIYNHPGRCGICMDISTMKRLAEISNVIGVKEVTGSIDRLSDVIAAFSDFSIMSGDDPTTFTFLANGGHGIISVASNLIPEKMKTLVDTCLNDNIAEARKLHLELLPLFRALSIETNPIPIKTAMNLCGLSAGQCRLPLCDLQPASKEVLEEALKTILAGAHG